ncbi:MAG: exodeoxyribonuclease III, partial [Gammaproteobacteria bacterium]|nr:exodeoxyribonuclease III [Gammaproteobacteria bacterium]
QETKVTDEQFPLDDLAAAGWHVLYAGQKSYNGVAMLSREPGELLATGLPTYEDPQRRVLAARYGDWTVLNLYVPNGSEVGSDKYRYKLDWLDALIDYTGTLLEESDKLVILGDFNIAPEDRDVHDPAKWAGSVLVSEPERERFRALLELGLTDTFRQFEQPEAVFSWWDYRAAKFRRNHGLRIDLVLASESAAGLCSGSTVDIEPRRWDKPSDHAPAVARFSAA